MVSKSINPSWEVFNITKLILIKNNKKGSSLIWVIILMAVFVILTSSMIFISRQDLLETVHFREKSKAYYVASSGIDMAYAALMKKPNPADAPLIQTYKNDHTKTHTQEIDIGDDKIYLSIDSVKVNGKWWVKVVSRGHVTSSNTSETVSLRIDVGLDNFVHLVRESK